MEVYLDEFDIWKIEGRRARVKSAAVLNIEIKDQKGRTTVGAQVCREKLEELRDDINYILENTKDVAGKDD